MSDDDPTPEQPDATDETDRDADREAEEKRAHRRADLQDPEADPTEAPFGEHFAGDSYRNTLRLN